MADAPPAPQPAQRPAPETHSPAVEIARVRPVLVPGAQSPPDSIAALLERPSLMQVPPPALTAPPTSLPAATAAGAFHIQIGAFQSQAEAERHLASIRERAGALLSNHSAVTTPHKQGEKVLYRARYAGFAAQATAASVCTELKRLSINCLVMTAE